MREIVRAEAWRSFRDLVEELGGDPTRILAAARVDENALVHPDRYVPLRWLLDSIEVASAQLNRKDFGLLSGFRASLSELGALSIAASNATSGREGWDVVGRYIQIHNPMLSIVIRPIPRSKHDLVSIDFSGTGIGKSPQYLERGTGLIHAGLRALCGAGYKPVEVWFRNARISPPAVYRRLFGVEPRFDMETVGIVVERATLDAPQPGRNSGLRALAETYLRSVGAPRNDQLSGKVASLVRGLLSNGECSTKQAASALGIHERTLQRRLSEENTSFEKIKDEVRRDMAEDLLAQSTVPLSHIAFVLGYADSATFSRSARRWFGMAPRNYRSRMAAPSGPSARRRFDAGRLAREAAILARAEEQDIPRSAMRRRK